MAERRLTAFAVVTAALLCVLLSGGCEQESVPTRAPTQQGCPRPVADTVSVPAPGLIGIVLSPGAELVFQIDGRRSRALIWDSLRTNFHDAYVDINVEIDQQGRVTQYDVLDEEGQPGATEEIWKAVSTWRFQGGCYLGAIRYIFNVSSSEIIIYRSGLRRAPGYENCEINLGRLHDVKRYRASHKFWPYYR